MASPPSEDEPVQLTLAWALPAVADTEVGAVGVVDGVTAADGAEDGLLPSALVATTVKVVAVPLVSPVTVQVSPVVVQVFPPGEAVTV